MYPQFFGFDKLPFRLRPDPEFLYPASEYVQARAAALTALRSRARTVVLIGRPGVGKTLLLEDVLREISGQFALCRINQPHISATELLQALVLQLGTTPSAANAGLARLFADLSEALDTPGSRASPPLLVIDDAQLLDGATLLALGDLQIRAPRLKVLLVGQDTSNALGAGFSARLAVPEPPRLVSMAALDAFGTRAYVGHRLRIAGGGGKEVFTPDAHAMVFQHTGGVPRLINVLCDAALHAACLRASGQVSSGEVLAATQDPRWPDAVAREKAGAAAHSGQSTASGGLGGYDSGAVNGAATTVLASDADLDRPLLESPRAAPGTTAAGATASPEGRLSVRHRKEHVGTWPLPAGQLSIGRATDNELRLEAVYISRHHCRILTENGVSTIVDLGSVNGLMVNGKQTRKHVLEHADQVVLGEHSLTYLRG